MTENIENITIEDIRHLAEQIAKIEGAHGRGRGDALTAWTLEVLQKEWTEIRNECSKFFRPKMDGIIRAARNRANR